MHTLGKRAFFLLLALLPGSRAPGSGYGDDPEPGPPPATYQIDRLTALDGLPLSGIVDIEQDEAGFL